MIFWIQFVTPLAIFDPVTPSPVVLLPVTGSSAPVIETVVTTAIVTEFMFKLFPGRSIFIKKKNLWGIVGVQHKYFPMFAAFTVTQTRTIQFLNVLSFLLTKIFSATVFFGIFYPAHSVSDFMTDQVNQIRRSEQTFVKSFSMFACAPTSPIFILLNNGNLLVCIV